MKRAEARQAAKHSLDADGDDVIDESANHHDTRPPLTVREAAEVLSLSLDVTRDQLRKGLLRGFRAGGQWRVPPDSISDYIIVRLSKAGAS